MADRDAHRVFRHTTTRFINGYERDTVRRGRGSSDGLVNSLCTGRWPATLPLERCRIRPGHASNGPFSPYPAHTRCSPVLRVGGYGYVSWLRGTEGFGPGSGARACFCWWACYPACSMTGASARPRNSSKAVNCANRRYRRIPVQNPLYPGTPAPRRSARHPHYCNFRGAGPLSFDRRSTTCSCVSRDVLPALNKFRRRLSISLRSTP